MIKSLIAVSYFVQSFMGAPVSYETDRASRESQTYVYICNSGTAKKYHYAKRCRGLGACTHSIIQVSLSDAKRKYGRTLCGWED